MKMCRLGRFSRIVAKCALAVAAVSIAGCEPEAAFAPKPPPAGPDADTKVTLLDRIIISRREVCCGNSLWTARTDGTDLRLLVGGLQYPQTPSVSPDGRRVVFVDGFDLFTVDADGRNKREIPSELRQHLNVQWSPVDDWIVFEAADAGGHNRQIYLARPNGTERRRLTDAQEGNAMGPVWSPDGSAILFVRRLPDQHAGSAVIMDLATGAERIVSDMSRPFSGHQPDWSPDGRWITFLDFEESVGFHDVIFRLDLVTHEYIALDPWEGGGPAPPRWSPDGSGLLIGSGDLSIIRPDGSDRRVLLSDSTMVLDADWTPAARP